MGGSSFSLHWGAPTNWNFLKECTLRILPAATTPPPPSLYRLTYHFPGLAPIWAAQNETGVGFINPETKVPGITSAPHQTTRIFRCHTFEKVTVTTASNLLPNLQPRPSHRHSCSSWNRRRLEYLAGGDGAEHQRE